MIELEYRSNKKMKRKYNCLLYLILFTASFTAEIFPGDKVYSVDKIPKMLMKDADAVIRMNEIRFEVFDGNNAVKKVKFAATIFKKDGQHLGRLVLWYDKFREINDLEGKIYDSAGEEIRDLEDDNIKDYSAFSGYTFYDDNRVRVSELYHNSFPYTVEFIYTISYDEDFNWPTWYSRTTLDPVEKSRFEAILPENQALRYWSNNDSVKAIIREEGGRKIYEWEINNQIKLPYDAYGDDIEDVASIIQIAPSEFEIEGYHGNMNSWKDFGAWYYSLYKDRMKLSAPVVSEVTALAGSSETEREKIKKVYKFMQSRTRYVNVSLGIGSWQPFDAQYVHSRGYGDCKALSNYMVSLLHAINIKAYPVLINSGDHRLPLITEFPSSQFNHVIVCVPGDKDTVWLECTSQDILFGVIDSDNENRQALMVTPEGGVVVKTPVSHSKQNIQQRNTKVKLTSFGSAAAEIVTGWSGNQQNDILHRIIDATPEERERWILNAYEVPDIKLNNFTFYGIENKMSEIELNVQLVLPRYANASGSRIFFNPNIEERRTYIPKDIQKRYSPIRFEYPYIDIDTIYYSIPKGYSIEMLPEEVSLESSFGKFISTTKPLGDTSIAYTRYLEIETYSIPAGNYSEYRNFFAGVVKSDRGQVVLVKKIR